MHLPVLLILEIILASVAAALEAPAFLHVVSWTMVYFSVEFWIGDVSEGYVVDRQVFRDKHDYWHSQERENNSFTLYR